MNKLPILENVWFVKNDLIEDYGQQISTQQI